MPTPLRLLARGSWSESQRFSEILRKETVGGMLLLAAAGTALVWANSPWSDTYHTVSEFAFGPESLHLRLSVSAWAADGLLAIFFFVVGLELKREFVAGDLRDPRRAALPIAAAIGGMIVPRMEPMARPTRYSPEVRERAVRMVREHGPEHPSQWAAIVAIAAKLGCTSETLRRWVRQAERDTGQRAGLTTDERQRLKELEREVAS